MGSGSSKQLREDTKVVVVGGGFAGITVAIDLLHTGKVKLIDPKDSLFYNIGSARCCVEPSFVNQIFIPYKETFGDSFIRGKAVKINKDSNTATGSAGAFPAKNMPDYPSLSKDDGLQIYQDINKEILEAETIVCVGGGAVGVELSGEIKTDFPNKNVILIHSNNVLCSKRIKASAQSKLQALVKRKGIELMLDERVTDLDELQMNKCVKDQVLKTESGKEIKVDMVFKCTGMKWSTSNFTDAIGDSIDGNGQIKVDEFFKVEGTENIYAVGDITNINEEKMLATAEMHGKLLSKNLFAEANGRKMRRYKPAQFLMIVSVGRDSGIGQLAGVVVGELISKTLKSQDLLVSRHWDHMKQRRPTIVKI